MSFYGRRITSVFTSTQEPLQHKEEGTLIEIQLSDDDRLDWALKSFK